MIFFTPTGNKKTFKVVYFKSKNTPVFYTAMIHFCAMIDFLNSNKSNTLLSLITHDLLLSMMILSSLMILLYFLTIFQLFFINILMSYESLLNIDYYSSWSNMTFSNHAWIILATVSLPMKNVLLYPSFLWFKTSPSHRVVFLFYSSLVCATFIIDKVLGLKLTSNCSGSCKEIIILVIFLSWNEHHPWFSYLMIVKLI